MVSSFRDAFSKTGLAAKQEQSGHQVYINVYDMLPSSFLTQFGYYTFGIGIFHSGVEIAGQEYCFGGHEIEGLTGVFPTKAKEGPQGLRLKQSISMGVCKVSTAEILKILDSISKEFLGTTYNLLTRNCNHFSDELCLRLTGKHAPTWINRAAKLGTLFPCVIPSDWVEPPDLEGEVLGSPTRTPTLPQSPTLVRNTAMEHYDAINMKRKERFTDSRGGATSRSKSRSTL